jgi:hypothetical protein
MTPRLTVPKAASHVARRMLTAAATTLALAVAGCGGSSQPVAPTPVVAAPVLPEAPIPTPGARIRVANVGDTDLFTWVELPREVIRFREVRSNSVSEYVATEHGAYEGVGFGWAMSDVLIHPFRPGREAPLPAPLGGYAFTYYVRLEPDLPYPPYVRIVRITRDE